MLEAQHFSSSAQPRGSYALPDEFNGVVNEAVLHQSVRAHLLNRRHGTHATKTKSEVSGGGQKPWRQKGTGRARQGSIRAPHFRGGGVVFGPHPRSYRTDVPRKVRRLARVSALNARARDGALYVIERLALEEPKTREVAGLLAKLGLTGRKVCLLTTGHRPDVYRSSRNIPRVRVLPYTEAAAYDLLWADVLVVEEDAIGGHAIAGSAAKKPTAREKRAKKATQARSKGKAVKRAKAAAPKQKSTKRVAKKGTRGGKTKGGGDA